MQNIGRARRDTYLDTEQEMRLLGVVQFNGFRWVPSHVYRNQGHYQLPPIT